MSTDRFEYSAGARIPGTNYKVVRRIGAGGMGVVYEVEDVSIEKRYVLKTIQARLAGRDDAVERFIREAKALAKLDHKNIVQVFTAGVTGDAMALRYFVMEKLHGHSLRTVLDNKHQLGIEAACRTIIELMGALDKAHERGIIHRDIKPENIFLHRDSNGITTLKLLDFGIMTSADARTVDRKGFVGTVRYAAPEQIQATDVSPSSDLYAATLVLYECIAGRGPFDEIVDFNQLVAAHIGRAPPPMRAFRSDVPPALEDLVRRGLAKNPAERPVDAFTYAAELNRIRRGLGAQELAAPTAVSTVHDLLGQDVASLAPSTEKDEGPSTRIADPPEIQPDHDVATRAEGRLAGKTTPAPSGPPTPILSPPAPPEVPLGGVTIVHEPPQMTLGPEAMAAAAALRPASGPGVVDRNAPTGTYLPNHSRSGAGGDTMHMSPVEQKNLQPYIPGAVQKTTRMEPVPQAFDTTQQPELTSTSASHSIGEPISVRHGASRVAWLIPVGLVGAAAAAGMLVFAFRGHAPKMPKSESLAPSSAIVAAATISAPSPTATEALAAPSDAPSATTTAAPTASAIASPTPRPHHAAAPASATKSTSSPPATSAPPPPTSTTVRHMPGSGL